MKIVSNESTKVKKPDFQKKKLCPNINPFFMRLERAPPSAALTKVSKQKLTSAILNFHSRSFPDNPFRPYEFPRFRFCACARSHIFVFDSPAEFPLSNLTVPKPGCVDISSPPTLSLWVTLLNKLIFFRNHFSHLTQVFATAVVTFVTGLSA